MATAGPSGVQPASIQNTAPSGAQISDQDMNNDPPRDQKFISLDPQMHENDELSIRVSHRERRDLLTDDYNSDDNSSVNSSVKTVRSVDMDRFGQHLLNQPPAKVNDNNNKFNEGDEVNEIYSMFGEDAEVQSFKNINAQGIVLDKAQIDIFKNSKITAYKETTLWSMIAQIST